MKDTSLWLAVLALLIFADAIFGGIYLYRIKGFLVRFVPSIALYILAYLAGHNDELHEILSGYNTAFIIIVVIAVIAVIVSLCDMFRIVMRADDLDRRYRHRHGHRRTTPAHH